MATTTIVHPKVVSQSEWLDARKKLFEKEKELTHLRDALAAERLDLPWVRVEKNYIFDTPTGKKSLSDLFEGRSQLAIYHFMFGPEWKEGCPGCSITADGFDAANVHLAQRDVTLCAVSRATMPQIDAFQKRMGWKFPWVSSNTNAFNYDYKVSFTKEQIAAGKNYNFGTVDFAMDEGPGLSFFYKDPSGQIFHTYSTYARGGEEMIGAYFFLDRAPKGRDEENFKPHPMAWVRHHDRYEPRAAEPARSKAAAVKAADSGCCSSGSH
jgi:predicted dithiol-disulfide oxidoreductase (DUF899 family)